MIKQLNNIKQEIKQELYTHNIEYVDRPCFLKRFYKDEQLYSKIFVVEYYKISEFLEVLKLNKKYIKKIYILFNQEKNDLFFKHLSYIANSYDFMYDECLNLIGAYLDDKNNRYSLKNGWSNI